MTTFLQALIVIEIFLILSITTYFLGRFTISKKFISDKFISLSKNSKQDIFIAGFITLLFISVIILILVSIYMAIFHLNVINL